jgi:hypothetical protein
VGRQDHLIYHLKVEQLLSCPFGAVIFNTDHGSQLISVAFFGMLIAAGVRISMDGCGLWMDHVLIERQW